MSVLDIKKSLPALFAQQVKATPDAPALEDETTSYTYSELDGKVASLSERLRSYGVARDKLVGVLLPRSADYVIACLAALRAGGAFLVLELAYPTDLLTDVIEDSKPVVVVTYSSEVGKLKGKTPLIVLDEPSSPSSGFVHINSNGLVNGIDHASETSVENSSHSDVDTPELTNEDDLERLAFVAYSSGTTGKPKGIANPHRAAVLSYDLRFGFSDLRPGDRVACNVFFIWEILRPLLRGATVVAVPDEVSYDPVMLLELLAAKRITETLMTPTLLAAVLSREPNVGAKLRDLKTLWLNGEVVTTDLARRALKSMPQTRLLNVYSACETHEVACGDIREMISMIDSEATYCPVGAPLDLRHTYILGDNGERAEVGTSGELYVGGSLLARGYLNLPETTSKAFIDDPYDRSFGAHMYRTGDLARMLPSGLLEITGRVGAMIKLRGYSVVPGKVENAIVKHLGVRHCAVVATGEGLGRQLVAYFARDKDASTERPVPEVDDSGHSPSARKSLLSYLAHYMIPALWVELDELPTHGVSGKVDLKSLPPAPSPGTPRSPVTGRKATLDPITVDHIAEIWASTLNISRNTITAEHSFFDLGGHSLTLADLAARLSRNFGLKVPVSRLAAPATLNGHLDTVRSIRDGHTAAVQADLPAVLRADSVLDEEIKSTGSAMYPVNKAKVVFLTGATGFLGAFLLNDLLQHTSAKILCLVRFTEPHEADKPAGIARLRNNLLDLGLWNDTLMERIEIIPGNLSRKRLGMSQEDFEELAHRTQVIIHAAASVNLVYPYAALRDANVGGTREILRLASIGGATVQHISTNGVLPASGADGWWENAMLKVDEVPNLADGYGQTKWVAEQLVVEARRRKMPVRIHRLGTVSGHSRTGAGNTWDLLNALLVESIRIGHRPDVDGWRAEMTPVDFVSQSIVHLSNELEAKQLVFHLGDPDPVDTNVLFDDIATLGYETKPLPFDDWVALWNEKRGIMKGGDGSFTINILRSGMPSVEFLKDIVVLNNIATRPFRAIVERPKVGPQLLETYARNWFARGWLPHPPLSTEALGGSAQPIRRGPLSGRVAVVTGASSGIGAAVAAALAREGCHIALAARRVDALEAVKRRIAVREGKVIIRQTDVTDESQVQALMKAANDELGPIDILISCAGVMYFTMMKNTNMEQWTKTVDVNCKGLLHCLGATVPSMLSRGTGHIVAISSDAGRKVFPGLGVYSASKFFVEATLQSLRLETSGSGLRVTSVQPGNVATDLLGMSTDEEALKQYGQPTGAKVLSPEDVAGSIVHVLKQPEHVSINEVLIEPREEPI